MCIKLLYTALFTNVVLWTSYTVLFLHKHTPFDWLWVLITKLINQVNCKGGKQLAFIDFLYNDWLSKRCIDQKKPLTGCSSQYYTISLCVKNESLDSPLANLQRQVYKRAFTFSRRVFLLSISFFELVGRTDRNRVLKDSQVSGVFILGPPENEQEQEVHQLQHNVKRRPKTTCINGSKSKALFQQQSQ